MKGDSANASATRVLTPVEPSHLGLVEASSEKHVRELRNHISIKDAKLLSPAQCGM